MKHKLSAVVALIFGAANFSAHAATTASVSQTFNFPFMFSGVTTSSSKQYVLSPNSGNNEAAVIPFNTTLGTLNSVDVNWDFGVSFSGVTGASVGNVELSMGGTTYLGGVPYDGGGTGGSNGAAPNTPFSVVATQASSHKNFTAAGAGVTYNPAIWAALSGNSSYAAKLAVGGSSLNYTGLASGTFTTNADLVVTYTYTA
ncbi:hypothetical protein HQ447_13220, partial [bacterium]|nr:hypothetical protein [bacterium]